MKKTILALSAATVAIGSAHATQIFVDDFQAYAVANPAPAVLDSDLFDANNVTWTGSGVLNEHRIFNTVPNYGTTQLWISNVDGSTLTSSGIALQNDMTYTLDFFSGVETSVGTRTLNASVDILVGQTLGTATSALGGAQAYIATGDDAILDNDKSDQMFQQAFNSGTITPGDQLFIVFTRVSILNSGGWFAVDDVSIDETATAIPEPSSTALIGLGALGMLLRRRR